MDSERGTITVTQSLTTLNRGFIVQEPKTKSGKRTIPLFPEVVEELKARRKGDLRKTYSKVLPGLKEQAVERLRGFLPLNRHET